MIVAHKVNGDRMSNKQHGENLRKGRISQHHQTYLITSVTYNRQPIFTEFYCARLLIRNLIDLQERGFVASLSYVIMPDHFHWLVTLKSGTLSSVMKHVKGGSARQINLWRGTNGSLWQAGYHEHALRCDEDLRQVSRYVISNPIRAGLVDNMMDYPHWDAIWM